MDMHHWLCQISSIASTWQKKALEFDEFEKLSFFNFGHITFGILTFLFEYHSVHLDYTQQVSYSYRGGMTPNPPFPTTHCIYWYK